MATRTTLHAKLRVLIARTLRMEKLYAPASQPVLKALRPENFSDIAQNIQGVEWQTCHSRLRKYLTEALALESSRIIYERLEAIRRDFENHLLETIQVVEGKKHELLESVRREEFSSSAKLSLELVCLRARVQANEAIVKALSFLGEEGRNREEDIRFQYQEKNPFKGKDKQSPQIKDKLLSGISIEKETMSTISNVISSNVIPFIRRAL